MVDYSSNNYLENVRFALTFLNKFIVGYVKTEMLFLSDYDFWSNGVCAWLHSKIETTVSTVNMLEKLVYKIMKLKSEKAIFNSNQDTAFTSKQVADFCNSNDITN